VYEGSHPRSSQLFSGTRVTSRYGATPAGLNLPAVVVRADSRTSLTSVGGSHSAVEHSTSVHRRPRATRSVGDYEPGASTGQVTYRPGVSVVSLIHCDMRRRGAGSTRVV
jgi:hypothetical protein